MACTIDSFRNEMTEVLTIFKSEHHTLNAKEIISLLNSLSRIADKVDALKTEEEIIYNKMIADKLIKDPKASVSKVEAIMKSTIHYENLKKANDLKHYLTRMINIAKLSFHNLAGINEKFL